MQAGVNMNCLKYRKVPFFLIILLLFSCAVPYMKLSAKEAPKVIRVGYYQAAGFQDYNEETGVYSGYSYDFLMALGQYTGWNYEFVPCEFSEGLIMLENGELDVMNNVSKTAEREEVLDFSALSAGENIAYLVMKPGDSRVAYEDFQALETIQIGLAKDSIYSERLLNYCSEKGITPNVQWFESRDALTEAYNTGKVDAYIITSSLKTSEHIILSFYPDSYYLATTKGNSEVMEALNSAIKALRTNDPYFEIHLKEKYYGQTTENYTVLTADEKEFLAENPVIRVTYQSGWYPISYQNEKGEFAGAVRRIYDLLEERTGLKFEYIPLDLHEDGENLGEDYQAQIMAELPSDFSHVAKYNVKLTKSFVTPPLMEVSNHLLVQGDSIALIEGDYLSEVCQRIYGDSFQYLYYDTVEECLDAVTENKADGTVLISYESEYYRQKRKYSALTYTVIDVGSYGLSIAVFNDADPRLYEIVKKGLNSISAGEISNIFNDTVVSLQKDDLFTVMYRNPLPSLLLIVLFLGLVIGGSLGIWFLGRLKRQNAVIKSKNEELRQSNQATTEFFARMSHDMRTPLNGILGTTALALDAEEHSEQMGEYLHDIKFSGEFLLNLINDVLDMSKIESGAMELFPEVYTYSEFITNMTKMIEPLCLEKNITLEMNPMKDDAAIRVDKLRFQQIFFNIFSNAVKYTPEGGKIVHYTEVEPLDEHHIDCKCHIIDNCGNPDNPSLVLFHGVGDDAALMWIYNAKYLSQYFCVYAVDTLGGPGKSVPGEKYDKEFDDVLWIDQILDKLEIEQAFFAGVSHGGYLVQLYTLCRPERVKKGISIASAVPVGKKGSPMATMMKIFFPEALFPTQKNVKKLIQKLSGENAAAFTENQDIMEHYTCLLKGFNNMAMGYHKVRTFTEEEVDAIREKVEYLVGLEDPFEKLGGENALKENHMKVTFYEKAGHGLNHERAEEINEKIKNICNVDF